MAQLSWEIQEHPRGGRVREAGGEFGRKSGRKTEVLKNLDGGKALDAICMGLFGGRGTVSVGEGWTGHGVAWGFTPQSCQACDAPRPGKGLNTLSRD